MRRRRLILLAAACAVLAGALIWFLTREREPSYKGRTLSEWIIASQYLARPPTAQSSQAKAAVHELCTNALPLLVKWMQYEQPAWKRRLYAGLLKLPRRLTPVWLMHAVNKSRQSQSDLLALQGFGILGGYATQAAPALTRLMNDPSKSRLMRRRAMICLCEILGSDGMLYLLSGEADLEVRADAVQIASSSPRAYILDWGE